jgi:hypothetical protein
VVPGSLSGSKTLTFRERCDLLRQSVGSRSSWDIGLLLAVSTVVIVVASVNIALMDREEKVLLRYRAVFRLVRERRLVAAHHLPDPELFLQMDNATTTGNQQQYDHNLRHGGDGRNITDNSGETRTGESPSELHSAAYWLNVAIVFIASVVAVISIGALIIRNLPPLSPSSTF